MQDEDVVTIHLTANGVPHHLVVEPRRLLSDVLREDLGLTGTNVGCEHGVCGSCTVLMDGQSVRSCLMFAVQANGHEVMTVEGLARNGEMHPLQKAFWEKQGVQCGFCTPGLIVAARDLLSGRRGITLRERAVGEPCRAVGPRRTSVAGEVISDE